MAEKDWTKSKQLREEEEDEDGGREILFCWTLPVLPPNISFIEWQRVKVFNQIVNAPPKQVRLCHRYECKFHVILHSHLYVIGGVESLPLPPQRVTDFTLPPNRIKTTINFYSKEVASFNLDLPPTAPGLTKDVTREMNIPRCNPHTAVVDGKIYVWGGFHPEYYPETSGWMEVFLPQTATWRSLKNPPVNIDPHSIRSTVLLAKKQILIITTCLDRVSYKFHYFDLTKNEWKTEDWGWGVPTEVTRVLAEGNTLYWIDTSPLPHRSTSHIRIDGIDLETRLQLHGWLDTHRVHDQSTNIGEEFYHVASQYFLNLSDQKFCLFFYTYIPKKGTAKPYRLYRLILDISRDGNENLNISIMSYQWYAYSTFVPIQDCLLRPSKAEETQVTK